MHTNFVSVQADAELEAVVKMLRRNDVISAPVLDGDKFIGVISDVDLVRYFGSPRYASIWKGSRDTPLKEMVKATARKIVRRNAPTVAPDQEVNSVLNKISGKDGCLPVVKEGKLVGVIRGSDILVLFENEFAKAAGKKKQEAVDEGDVWDTDVDKIYAVVKREGRVSASKVAKELGIDQKTVEALAEVLHRNGLLDVNYSLFGGPTLRVVNHEEK